MIEAVIFDLDGVIIESEDVWERVRRAFVEAHGGNWRDESSRRLMGVSTHEWAHYLVAEFGVQLSEQEVADHVINAMRREYDRHLPLVPGAAAAVRQLSADWPLAVASGSPLSLIEAVLEGAHIEDAFRVLVSCDEVAAGKPAPDVYLEAARRLDVSIRQCAVVEDSGNGIKSAVSAGARVIAIPSAIHPPGRETLALATIVLGDIGSLTAETIRSDPRAL